MPTDTRLHVVLALVGMARNIAASVEDKRLMRLLDHADYLLSLCIVPGEPDLQAFRAYVDGLSAGDTDLKGLARELDRC